jgi:ketosteroid isomerase-like protein
METLAGWVAAPVGLWELDEDSVISSGTFASAFINEAMPDQNRVPGWKGRALYVFRKEAKGWRAVRQAIMARP